MSVLKANELKANDVKIPSVTEGREIIRWAFEQKKTGEVYFIDNRSNNSCTPNFN